MSVVASRPHPPEKEVRVITIGIDPHTRTHAAGARDEGGGVLAEITVGLDPPELDRLVRWVEGIGPERIVAVEGARGFGLALSRRVPPAGGTVLAGPPAARPARTTGEMPWRWHASRCANRASRASRRM